MTRISLLAATTLACSLTLGACSREAEAPREDNMIIEPMTNDMTGAMGNDITPAQSATFAGGDGAQMGSVSMTEGAGGVTLMIEAMGMPAGVHGIHLHETGRCDGPSFESAGAHWNPTSKQHGRENPQGPHLGDLENITVPATGSGSISVMVPGGTMAAMADADGTALVVHAQADDYRTDPSGSSGDRIACAVVAAPTAAAVATP